MIEPGRLPLCGFASALGHSHDAPPPARIDPLQPYAVRVAVCAVGGGDGLGGRRTGRAAAAVSLARFAGHFGLHGVCPQRGDGFQSAGRPAARCAEPANAYAALARRRPYRRQRGAVYGRSARWVLWRHAAVSAAESIPLAASLPVLVFLFGYSFAKRFTVLSHFWLGAALMLAPLAAWVAIRGGTGLAAVAAGAAVLLWVAGFDIIYACQDFDFDVRCGCAACPPASASPGPCGWPPRATSAR